MLWESINLMIGLWLKWRGGRGKKPLILIIYSKTERIPWTKLLENAGLTADDWCVYTYVEPDGVWIIIRRRFMITLKSLQRTVRSHTHTHYHQCSLWMHRDSYAHNLGSIHPSTALKSACIHYSRLRRASKRFRSSFFILSLLCKKSWKEFDMFEYKNREKSARAHVQAFNTHDAKTRPTIIWRNTTFLSKKMCVNSKGLFGVYSSDA